MVSVVVASGGKGEEDVLFQIIQSCQVSRSQEWGIGKMGVDELRTDELSDLGVVVLVREPSSASRTTSLGRSHPGGQFRGDRKKG